MPLVTPQSHRAQRLLEERGETVAVAESLTGGRLAVLLTEAPGSSATFLGGVVSYATEAKIDVLGVDRGLVERHGVVSAECARAMARGVRAPDGVDVRREHDRRRRTRRPGGQAAGHGVRRGGRPRRATRRSRWSWSGGRAAIQDRTCAEALSALAGIIREEETGLG